MRSTIVRITTATSLMAVGGLLLTSGLAGATDEAPDTTAQIVEQVIVEEPTTMTVNAGNLDSHACSEAWRFVITKVGETVAVPESIFVTWTDGGSATVGLSYTEGTTAHYRIAKHLDSEVAGATVVIDTAWRGSFKLSHGPCTVETTAPETTAPPSETTLPEESTTTAAPATTPEAVVTTAGAPSSVAGVTIPAQQLPSTGSTASTLSLAGVALLAVGAALLSVRRRPTRA